MVSAQFRFVEKNIGRVLVYGVLILVALTTIVPFWVMLSVSFTKGIHFISFPAALVAWPITLDNYSLLFARTMVERWLFNSFYCGIVGTGGCLITSSMAGYAFARGSFVGRDVIFAAFLGLFIMPSIALIVPLFVTLSRLHLVNTYTALIGPWFASVFGTFLLRQAYFSIPRDFDDAAVIDGANVWQVYYHVLLLQIKPALVTLAILRFMAFWNDFLYPMIVTSRPEMRLLTVGLATIHIEVPNPGLDMAGAVMGFLPTFIIFLFGQRYFVETASLAGLKG